MGVYFENTGLGVLGIAGPALRVSPGRCVVVRKTPGFRAAFTGEVGAGWVQGCRRWMGIFKEHRARSFWKRRGGVEGCRWPLRSCSVGAGPACLAFGLVPNAPWLLTRRGQRVGSVCSCRQKPRAACEQCGCRAWTGARATCLAHGKHRVQLVPSVVGLCGQNTLTF